MKKLFFVVIFIVVVGFVWLYIHDNGISTTSNSSLSKTEITQLVDIKKYYNQPINAVKNDWPSAEYSVDGRRIIFKNDDFNLVVASQQEESLAYFVQAQIKRNVECNSRNATEQIRISLDQVGLSDVYKNKPQQENPDSELYCFKQEDYMINTSCSYGSNTYTISISDYDDALCN